MSTPEERRDRDNERVAMEGCASALTGLMVVALVGALLVRLIHWIWSP